MFAELIARACSGAIQLLTGARALWLGCAPSSAHRVYYGNHTSHGDFVLIWSSLPPALRRHLLDLGVAEYKLPDRFRLTDALPLTAVGKIDKRSLRDSLTAANA